MRSLAPSELAEVLGQVVVVDLRPHPTPLPASWQPVRQVNFEKIQTGDHGLPRERPLLLVCERGILSELAGLYLELEGFQVYHLEGGLQSLKGSVKEATDEPLP
jgi:rhodanese-related sulfurtransferase